MSDLLKRLIEEFDHEATSSWQDKEVGDFVDYLFPSLVADDETAESRGRSGHMALGAIIWMPDEERDAAWAKFQLEKES